MSDTPTGLKARLRTDLTASMKARDTTATATLRMALAAVTTAEVAGDTAKELTDDEVVAVLGREVRKRREAAEAFDGAGRTELADRERAEAEVLGRYLPQPLSDGELTEAIAAARAELEADGTPVTMKQMGQLIKAVQARAAGRVDGARLATAVRASLA
jgi:uncharacterized protein YqeY